MGFFFIVLFVICYLSFVLCPLSFVPPPELAEGSPSPRPPISPIIPQQISALLSGLIREMLAIQSDYPHKTD